MTFRSNADGRIATVQLRWEDPDTHQVTEINGNFNTWDLAQSFEQADPRFQQLAVVVNCCATALGPREHLLPNWLRMPIGCHPLWNDPEVVEFANLDCWVSRIRTLGN